MKRLNFLFLAVALLCLATACSNKNDKSRDERIKEFRAELTEADTTAMLNLCDNAMEQLKAHNIDNVLSMLYLYNDSTEEIMPLTEQMSKRYSKRFKMFPVLEYHRVYYSFMLEGCNDVKYEVTFASADQVGGDKPATTMYMFNPVKIGGEWKLCVKMPQDEHDENYY